MKSPSQYITSVLFFLTAICLFSPTALAELPPNVYSNMQDNSPEAVEIHVEKVGLDWCFLCSKRDVTITATTHKRSAVPHPNHSQPHRGAGRSPCIARRLF